MSDSRRREHTVHHRVCIESLGTFLPEIRRSSQEVVSGVKKVKNLPLVLATGIRERRVAEGSSSFKLAHEALNRCLDQSVYGPMDIDALICCNISKSNRDGTYIEYEPSMATSLAEANGMKRALTFDLNNACAGMFTGILVAKSMIESGVARRVAIVSGEYISHLGKTAQLEIENISDPRLACLTLGDGGAALILDQSSHGSRGFGDVDLRTFDEYADLCVGRPSFEAHGGIIMNTDSTALLKVGIAKSVKVLHHHLGAGEERSIKGMKVIPHQVSSQAPELIRRSLNRGLAEAAFSKEQFVSYVEDFGNTASTAHMIALDRALSEGLIEPNSQVVFMIQGSGLTVGAAFYNVGDLPNQAQDGIGQASSLNLDRSEQTLLLETPRLKLEGVGLCDHMGASSVEFGVEAVQDLAEASWQREDIAHLIYCGQYRTDWVEEPSHAALISSELRLGSDDRETPFLAFDVINGSLGWLHACFVASSLVRADRQKSLVVSSEASSVEATSLNIKSTGSAALLSEAQGDQGFCRFYFKSYLSYLRFREVKLNCETYPSRLEFQVHDRYEDYLLQCTRCAMIDYLKVVDETLASFDGYILPRPSPRFLSLLLDQLHLPSEKVLSDLHDKDYFTANSAASMRPLVEGSRGQKILVVEATAGIQVGIATYLT